MPSLVTRRNFSHVRDPCHIHHVSTEANVLLFILIDACCLLFHLRFKCVDCTKFLRSKVFFNRHEPYVDIPIYVYPVDLALSPQSESLTIQMYANCLSKAIHFDNVAFLFGAFSESFSITYFNEDISTKKDPAREEVFHFSTGIRV